MLVCPYEEVDEYRDMGSKNIFIIGPKSLDIIYNLLMLYVDWSSSIEKKGRREEQEVEVEEGRREEQEVEVEEGRRERNIQHNPPCSLPRFNSLSWSHKKSWA